MLCGGFEDAVLSARADAALREPSNEVFVSPVSVWEVETKRAIGKLGGDWDVGAESLATGFTELALTFSHARLAGSLPLYHRDPFDRMLIAQARVEGLTLVTSDPQVGRYEVSLLAASGT